MARKKQGDPFGLCISIFKLEQLMRNKGGVVSHPATMRWLQFFEKQRLTKVKFFALPCGEYHVFSIKYRRKKRILGEDVIEILCYEEDQNTQTGTALHDK